MSRTGVLLVNLGTPASPSVRDVRRYLREFLGDPYVIDLPAPARWLLLNAVILPTRPRASAVAYQKVWTPEGSPLLVHGRALCSAVSDALGGDFAVELAMRYGEPAIDGAVARLAAAGVCRWVVVPLFPQYSTAATRSAIDAVERALAKRRDAPVDVVRDFFADPGFVAAWETVARPRLDAFRPEHVLFSFHGLPERQLRASGAHCLASPGCCDAVGEVNRSCYRAQCLATARALARALALGPEDHSVSFQSRLGRTRWIQPYTDQLLPELAARGVKRLAVLCPSFVADCLETLEEIAIRGRQQWLEIGGEALELVPSLNTDPAWVDALAHLVRCRADRLT
ncbi:MAG: ferrochelatase [Myxococcota bacterium]